MAKIVLDIILVNNFNYKIDIYFFHALISYLIAFYCNMCADFNYMMVICSFHALTSYLICFLYHCVYVNFNYMIGICSYSLCNLSHPLCFLYLFVKYQVRSSFLYMNERSKLKSCI